MASERRYNYTTPKSFLEQISLYTRLLKTKASELRGRVARLENGLEKLRSTAVQVDKLKEKLAMQELELQQKNEAADTLIAIVGVETEKVQKEKAIGKKRRRKRKTFPPPRRIESYSRLSRLSPSSQPTRRNRRSP